MSYASGSDDDSMSGDLIPDVSVDVYVMSYI